MADQPPNEPKIIVDEDWKSRVTAEKEAAAHQPPDKKQPPDEQPPPAQPAAAKSDNSTSTASRPPQSAGQALPPATLSFLVTTLATQAMMALGEVPHPLTGKTELRLPEARHFIDMLTMLEEKTAGHRTPEESALLDHFLHQLRLAYVELQAQSREGM